MSDLEQLSKFVVFLKTLMKKGSFKLHGESTKIVLFLRKSKSGSTIAQSPMSLKVQQTMCLAFCQHKFAKFHVIDTVNSNESGVTMNRPCLQQAITKCHQHGAALVVAKVDRLARNIAIFSTLALSAVPIFFAEFPTLDLRDGTGAEKAAMFRAALESHLEGLRIQDRVRVQTK